MKTVITWIFAGGMIQEEFVKEYIGMNRADRIIAVDGGLLSVDRLGLRPTHIVGDFDTVERELLEYYQADEKIQIRKFQPEKDLTDSQIAVELALELHSTKIVFFGATGSRLDHVLGNLHLLSMAEQKGVFCEILDANNRIFLLEAGKEYPVAKRTQFGTYISLIPFTDSVEGITLTGFKYPLTDFTMTRFTNPTLGLSNEIVEEKGSIWFSKGVLICVESRD